VLAEVFIYAKIAFAKKKKFIKHSCDNAEVMIKKNL
jgi:hypothetical protein